MKFFQLSHPENKKELKLVNADNIEKIDIDGEQFTISVHYVSGREATKLFFKSKEEFGRELTRILASLDALQQNRTLIQPVF
jgi:hypothetical protein